MYNPPSNNSNHSSASSSASVAATSTRPHRSTPDAPPLVHSNAAPSGNGGFVSSSLPPPFTPGTPQPHGAFQNHNDSHGVVQQQQQQGQTTRLTTTVYHHPPATAHLYSGNSAGGGGVTRTSHTNLYTSAGSVVGGGITQRIHPHGVTTAPTSSHHNYGNPHHHHQQQQQQQQQQQEPISQHRLASYGSQPQPPPTAVRQTAQHQAFRGVNQASQQQQQQQQPLLQQQRQQQQIPGATRPVMAPPQQLRTSMQQQQQPQQQGFVSAVPNPLAGSVVVAAPVNHGSGNSNMQSSPHVAQQLHRQPQHVPQQQQQQALRTAVILPTTMQLPSSSSNSAIQQQPPQQQQQVAKPKVVLSQEAKQALAKAIWSAIRSPDGSVAPDLMDAAMATGLPRHAILNAARVAREREAQKRMQVAAQQQQQQQQQQQHGKVNVPNVPSSTTSLASSGQGIAPPMTPSSSQRKSATTGVSSGMTTTSSHHKMMPPPTAVAATTKMSAMTVVASDSKIILATAKHTPVTSNQPNNANATTVASSNVSAASSAASSSSAASKELAAKLEEQSNWKRLQSGLLVTQKGRFMAVPNTVGGIVRSSNQISKASAGSAATTNTRKRPRSEIVAQAALLQRQILSQAAATASAPSSSFTASNVLSEAILQIDPEKYKRIKIEPKRAVKALDRIARKCRQTAAESLIKQHKELSKQIASHQQEFVKYHKSRRAEAARIAKAVRDSLGKVEKHKGKSADQAERARLAALRANDMAAYSKLLEETKHHRLKYLLDKTDECIAQISTLLQKRSADDCNTDAFVAASEASSGSYYASAHLKMEEVRQPTCLVGGELKEYQLAGLQWLVSLYNNQLNGILADEMGLGKTIQAISLVAYLSEFKHKPGPYLVIVPLSTLSNWQNEFSKWCPSAHVICYKGTPAQRKALYRDQVKNGHFNVLLTTYEYIIKDKSSLRKTSWLYAIVDEGHRMKNAQSKFAVTLGSQYSTKFRILLTGTPLMNDLSELWALLNFLLPAIFNSLETFDQWFNRPFAQFVSSAGASSGGGADDETDQLLTNEERMLIIHRLHELLRPFMLRRVKSEVLDQLPEKVEKVLRCELSSWQKELYKQISAKAVAETSPGDQQPTRGLNNVVMQLRKVCNHPFLFSPEGYHINENLIRSSGKVELLDRMLPKLRAAGHRVLMFTQMTAVMTILEDYFTYRGYLSLRLDGSTPAEEREKRMFKFNAPDSPYFIFLLSTRAGGLGLNLTAADTVIIFDSDWNPMMDLQAQDRAHRIGQRSDVSVFRLVTYSPVEEKILGRATEKLNMSELVVEAGKFDRSSVENDNSLERKRLMEVLLTDFDNTTTSLARSNSEPIDEGDPEDDGSDSSDKEDLNELLSNNEFDYQLYAAMDHKAASDPTGAAASTCTLFTSPEDVPDWIKFPTRRRNGGFKVDAAAADGSRKRKNVTYDDGLTEKQFLKLMERQADDDERVRKVAKTTSSSSRGSKGKATAVAVAADFEDDDHPADDDVAVAAAEAEDEEEAAPDNNPTTIELTDWTFRKLISCVKSVIALKDPATKRRLSDVFLEKPPPQTFPDYYEIIEKPIAINDILRKCRSKAFANLQEFRDDWKLMFANARKFNGDDSWVVRDGEALQRELERVLTKNGFADETPPSPKKKKKLRIKLSLKTLKTKPN